MIWFAGSFFGSISLVILNTLSKTLTLTFANLVLLGSLSLFTTGCFLFAWRTSPQQFLVVWFVQSGMVSIGAFLANNYWVQDALAFRHLLGICLILLGGLTLIKWT